MFKKGPAAAALLGCSGGYERQTATGYPLLLFLGLFIKKRDHVTAENERLAADLFDP